MAEDLKPLIIELAANVKGLERGLNKGSKQVRKFSGVNQRAAKRSAAAWAGLKKQMLGIVGGAGIVAGLRAFTQRIRQMASELDQMAKTADNMGMTIQQYSALVGVAQEAGAEKEKFSKALARLNKVIHDADDGLTTYVRAFERLGISVRDGGGNLKTTEQVFFEVKAAIDRTGASQSSLASLMDIFGARIGPKMVRVLSDMGGNMKQVEDRGRELGVVITESVARKAEKMANQFDVMGQQILAGGGKFFQPAIEWFGDLAEVIGDAFVALGDFSDRWRDLEDLDLSDLDEEIKRLEEKIAKPDDVGYFSGMRDPKKISADEEKLFAARGMKIAKQMSMSGMGQAMVLRDKMQLRTDKERMAAIEAEDKAAKEQAEARVKAAIEADKRRARTMSMQPYAGGQQALKDMGDSELVKRYEEEEIERLKLLDERAKAEREHAELARAQLEQSGEATRQFADALDSNLSRAFEDVISGTRSVGDAFKSMLASILSQVIQQQIAGPAASGLGSLLSAGIGYLTGGPAGAAAGAAGGRVAPAPGTVISTFPGAAQGGSVRRGRPVVVGEHGRELFIPHSGGRIAGHQPTERTLEGAAPPIINQTFNIESTDGPGVRRAIAEATPSIVQASKASVLDDMSRPSPMRSAMRAYG